MRWILSIGVTFCVAFNVYADACPSGELKGNWIFVDMSDESQVKAYSFLPLDCKEKDTAAFCAKWQEQTKKDPPLQNFKDILKFDKKQPESEVRWVATKGEVVNVAIIYVDGRVPVSQIVETSRNTRFADDLKKLVELIEKAKLAGGEHFLKAECLAPYSLTDKRAKLVVRVGPISVTPGSSGTSKTASGESDTKKSDGSAAKGSSKDSSLVDAITLVTGPREHLYISADVPVTSTQVLKFDSTANTLVFKDAPTNILVGINYALGDVWPQGRNWTWQNLGFKALFKLDSNPLKTVGAAVSYRAWGMNVFGGYLWMKEDQQTGTGTSGTPIIDPESHYRGAWRLGLGFNLDTAIGWVKSTGSGSSSSTKK